MKTIQLNFKEWGVALFFFAIAICFMNYSLHFHGFTHNDSYDYAQLARNIYEGKGYSTSVLRPLVYQFYQTLPQPEITRVPGYPYLLALFFKLFGPSDSSIIMINSISYVALVLLVYFLTYKLSGHVFASLASALMVACTQSFLVQSLYAEPNVMCAALFMAFFYFYFQYQQRILTHGILLGLICLVRPNMQFVFSAFLLLMMFQSSINVKEKLKTMTQLSAGFFIGISPYLIRNYVVTGNPFFSLYNYSFLLYTKSFPAYGLWAHIVDINPLIFVADHFKEIVMKSFKMFFLLLRESLGFYKLEILILTGLGFFMPTKNIQVRRLKMVTFVGVIIQTIFLAPVMAQPYYYMFFFPAMLVVFTNSMLEHLKKFTNIAIAGVLLVFLFTLIPYWKSPQEINPFISIGDQVKKLTDEDDIILTDIPWETTWYADRRTIWLPYDIDTLRKINKTLSPQYLLLSQWIVTRSYPHGPFGPYKDNMWAKMINNPSYAKNFGFELQNVIFMNNIPVAFMFRIM
jgi:4-amino-4-deoxy-L-arabinose transferase-like glycosyltransferase